MNEAVLGGETGLVFPPGDAPALAAALDRLLSDPALRRQMGEAARRRAFECFTLRQQAEATIRVFDNLLQQG